MKQITKFKRLLSGVMSAIITISTIPFTSATAEDSNEPYPYTMFAASNDEGAITVNADNFSVNGNVATNGTIVSSGNVNINGSRTEHANESMLYILKKLDYSYFSGEDVTIYTEDYIYEDLNISINNPIDVDGSIELTGNINLNSGIKAVDDITLNGEVKNANNAVICSETGSISIDTSNICFNGLIYAPYGNVVIDAGNLNLNNVVIIGQTITIDCPNVNINHNNDIAELIGSSSEEFNPIEETSYFLATGKYNSETSTIDMWWYASAELESVTLSSSPDNSIYEHIAVISDADTYSLPIDDSFTTTYFKFSYTDEDENIIESVPFIIEKNGDKIRTKLLDSDQDGLSDINEESLGTNPMLADIDNDGLTDREELVLTGTDPLVFDSITKHVSDADADSDGDELSNRAELELGTDSKLADTDGDELTDKEEHDKYFTDPLNEDTDGDTLSDGFEVKNGLNPLSAETNGVADINRQIEQNISTDSNILKSFNTAESPFELSLKIQTNGEADKELMVGKSSHSVSLATDSQIGEMIDLGISENCHPEKLTLEYKVKDAYLDNTLNKYSQFDDLKGIKRLCVFKYYENINMMLPLDTEYDVENNRLWAETDGLGTYCVMDLEIWFDLFDVEPEDVVVSEQDNTDNNQNSAPAESTISGQITQKSYLQAASTQ